jgi:hypothetical protein
VLDLRSKPGQGRKTNAAAETRENDAKEKKEQGARM